MRCSHLVWTLLLGTLLAAAGGCVTRIAGEAVGAVAGASGKYVSIQPLSMSAMSRYDMLKIEPLTSHLGHILPPGFSSQFETDLRTRLKEAKLLTGGTGRQLVLKGEIVHYEEDSLTDQAIGPLQEVIARLTLSDAQTGEVLGVANVIGRAKSSSAGGAGRLAEGLSKGVVKWLKQ